MKYATIRILDYIALTNLNSRAIEKLKEEKNAVFYLFSFIYCLMHIVFKTFKQVFIEILMNVCTCRYRESVPHIHTTELWKSRK